MRLSFSVGVVIGLGMCWCPSAQAATFVVNSTIDAVDAVPGNGVCATSGAACTLRAAIQEANALAGADTITLPAGTYILTLAGASEDLSATGDLDVLSVITVNGAGASTTIIGGNASDRVFNVFATGRLTLNDATVQNGLAVGPDPGVFDAGGGILALPGSTLALTRVVVRNNNGDAGGGILVFGDTGLAATATIAESTITQNTSSGADGAGGGITAFGLLTLTVSRSTISGNTSSEIGGGIAFFVDDNNGNMPTATITGSTISGNTSEDGGGVATWGNMTIANTTISGNTATQEGGAIRYDSELVSGLTTLVNVTIAGNSTGTGAAVYGEVSDPMVPPQLRVQNTIIANSTGAAPANCFADVGVVFTDLGNNLEFPGTTCGFGLASDRRADPLLAALAGNGGTTQTHALNTGSPAIDAGNDAACAAAPVSGVDQRGTARPSGAHCDIGAYELTVAPSPSPGPGTGPTPTTSFAPIISPMANQVIAVGGSVSVPFTVGAAIIVDAVSVTASSSNTALVPLAGLQISRLGGSQFSLRVTGADGRSGIATITVSANDGTQSSSTSFQVTAGSGVSGVTPSAPQVFNVSASGSGAVLTWTTPATGRPDWYAITGGLTPGGSSLPVVVVSGSLTSYTIPMLPSGTFFFRVYAGGGGGLGLGSAIAGVTMTNPAGTPGPPTGLQASVSGANATLTWSPPLIGAAPTLYQVEFGTAPGQSDIATVTATGTTITRGLPAGSGWMRVRSTNGGLISGPSNDVALPIQPSACSGAPVPPVLLPVTANLGLVTFSWVPGGGSAASRYRVEVRTSATGQITTLTTGGPGSSVVWLQTGGLFSARVIADNACGSSVRSNEVSFGFYALAPQ